MSINPLFDYTIRKSSLYEDEPRYMLWGFLGGLAGVVVVLVGYWVAT